ncbi:MAG: PQQ-binding-like beta-propeller repeat protein [Acidimicrobiales bacterium]
MSSQARAAAWVLAALLLGACGTGHHHQGPPRPPRSSAPAGGSAQTGHPSTSWTTYHGSPSRDGWAAGGPDPSSARVVWSARVTGAVLASPVIADGLVLVGTEDDAVVALSQGSGKVVWRADLGQPVPGSALPCGNVDPSGITGTPVVDPSRGLVWVVAFLRGGHHQLVSLDVRTGAVQTRRPADLPGDNPTVEQQRGALALDGNEVLIPYGGLFGDCGSYHGGLLAVPESGGSPRSWQVPAAKGGGIWAPSGPAVAPGGEIYVATGNSSPPDRFDYGDAVVELSPSLRPLSAFGPSDWSRLDAADLDLGSTGPVLVGGGMVFQVGKEGTGYLLRASELGGVGGQASSGPACGGGAYGASAAHGGMVFVPCAGGLVGLRLGGAGFSRAWRDPAVVSGSPVVAGGVVWAQVPRAGTLVALDPATGRKLGTLDVGVASRFAAPAVAAGRLVVAAGSTVESIG